MQGSSNDSLMFLRAVDISKSDTGMISKRFNQGVQSKILNNEFGVETTPIFSKIETLWFSLIMIQ